MGLMANTAFNAGYPLTQRDMSVVIQVNASALVTAPNCLYPQPRWLVHFPDARTLLLTFKD